MPQNPGEFTTRPVMKVDVPAIIALYRRAIVPEWIVGGRSYDLDRVEANLNARLDTAGYTTDVVTRDDVLVGYLAWEQHADHTSHHVVAHLRMLLVDPTVQRSGVATRLVERFEGAAKSAGCTKVLFDVIVGSPANDFYAQLGFRHWSNYMEKLL